MRERDVPVWIAALADVAVLLVFVAVGRRSHQEDAGMAGFLRVLWPFAIGLAGGWAVTALYRTPLAWRRALGACAVTVLVGVGLRIVVQDHDFAPTFVMIASLFIGGCMLGWRGVVASVSRRRSRRVTS
jgi:hypothetical protein